MVSLITGEDAQDCWGPALQAKTWMRLPLRVAVCAVLSRHLPVSAALRKPAPTREQCCVGLPLQSHRTTLPPSVCTVGAKASRQRPLCTVPSGRNRQRWFGTPAQAQTCTTVPFPPMMWVSASRQRLPAALRTSSLYLSLGRAGEADEHCNSDQRGA